MDKVKVFCLRRFSKKNFILKLSHYSTRAFVALVWCGVLWAFLTTDSLPRQYVDYLLSRTPKPCIQSSLEIPAEYSDQFLSLLPPSWNSSLSAYPDYELVALSNHLPNDNTSFQVLLVRQSSLCLNVFEFKGFTVLTPMFLNISSSGNTSSGSGGGEDILALTTELESSGTVDILTLLYPDTSSSLLNIPVGHFFALALLFVVSALFGVLAEWVLLPQLIGMIIAGFLLRNAPGIDFARHISNVWGSNIRNIALIIILMRGGLSMDFKQLLRLKLAVLLLAFIPCVLEGALDGVLALFLIKLPWQFAFTLGYSVAAISPSVVVPTTLNLQSRGYGQESGIPTLIVGAASLDVVISISIFGVFLGLAFSEGSLILDIFRAPIQIIIGLLYGVIFGLLLWVFPTKHFKKGSKVRNRFFLLFGLGLFSLFGSTRAVIGGSNLAGSGALGVLVLAFVAAQGWKEEEKKLVSRAFLIVWQFFEPLLFGLIGAAVDLRFISSSLVGQAVGVIVGGLVVRLLSSYVVVLGNKFSWLEMCFVSIAWIPKATVQAAIGPLALDIALMRNNDNEQSIEVQYGRQILTVAVLAVVLTAPLGALATSLLGPVFLKKSSISSSLSEGGSPTPQEEKLADQTTDPKHNKVHVSPPMVCASPPLTPNGVRPELQATPDDPSAVQHIELEDIVVIKEIDSEPRKY